MLQTTITKLDHRPIELRGHAQRDFRLDVLYGRGQFEKSAYSRAFVLAQFSESPENKANVIGVIADGFEFQLWTG